MDDETRQAYFRAVEDPRSRRLVEKLEPFLEWVSKYYFRCSFAGWERVPDGKVLFVGNHNGLITWEVPMMYHAWHQRFGMQRPALGLAHEGMFHLPVDPALVPRLGAIPADKQMALDAFERGYSLLVFPGGEKEAFRTYKERKKIDFFERKGFIRLALEAHVPIVPIVSIGAHESYVIMHRGEMLAERLGLRKRFRLHGVPLTLGSFFFLGLFASGLLLLFPFLVPPLALSMLVPLPTKMHFELLPCVDLHARYRSTLSREGNVQRIYDEIVASMQSTLSQGYAERLLPIFG